MGGIYDRSPEIYDSAIEEEYAKLEPYINIYSSSVVSMQRDPLLRDIQALCNIRGAREFFDSIVKEAKNKLNEMLEKQNQP